MRSRRLQMLQSFLSDCVGPTLLRLGFRGLSGMRWRRGGTVQVRAVLDSKATDPFRGAAFSPWAADCIGDFPVEDRKSQVLSLNGFVNIQYQHAAGNRNYPTRFGCVNRVVSSFSGVELEHVQYAKIFRALLRRLA